jgi:hypothetical protein
MAKIAGTLSMAKTTSIINFTNATNSGVAAVMCSYQKTFHGRYDLKSALSFKTFKTKDFFRFKFLIW